MPPHMHARIARSIASSPAPNVDRGLLPSVLCNGFAPGFAPFEDREKPLIAIFGVDAPDSAPRSSLAGDIFPLLFFKALEDNECGVVEEVSSSSGEGCVVEDGSVG